ncbi:hypothetical protein IGI04_015985 [Brassica rapa subsp. trilocularis]|uniref:Uncharacterized protein n=1 Tax=Brassica rapa subsp. trilocularis TaxID=1813537 RepID=A0ABQ7MRN4_BRACM|nr:hypothetical protein IGI04_015985 [Brassica rapa subsp. trilocularis]
MSNATLYSAAYNRLRSYNKKSDICKNLIVIHVIFKCLPVLQICREKILNLFSANVDVTITSQTLSKIDSQVICLENICLMDGSLTPTSQFSGCRWV